MLDSPVKYIRNNLCQRIVSEEVSIKFIEKMTWKSNEIVLDVGCGPGDVSSEILYPLIKNKVKQLVCTDKSNKMIKYAQKYYECSYLDFKVLDIENAEGCSSYARVFDKIFSFFCLHWVQNKFDALVNMKSMLKSNGEIGILYMFTNPILKTYKIMDTEWHTYANKTLQSKKQVYSEDELSTLFKKAGFQIVSIETSQKKFIYPNYTSLIDAFRLVDEMFHVLPPEEHERYSMHFRNTLPKTQLVEICPTTGKTTLIYYPAIIHAVAYNC